ncbi:g11317 [Coccomyxa elongata]
MAAMTARYTPSAVGVTNRIASTSDRQITGLKALPAPTRFNKRAAVQVVRASDDKGNTATKESPLESINQQSTAKLNEVIQDLPAEQQKALSQLYLFLVQNPRHNIRVRGWRDVQRAIAEDYQVLVWRPAELLNGRLAMIGFFLGAITQSRTGISVTFGSPREGISIGPIKFSQRAELLNARMAMVGYAILAYVGYNQDLARAISLLLRSAQSNLPGMSA